MVAAVAPDKCLVLYFGLSRPPRKPYEFIDILWRPVVAVRYNPRIALMVLKEAMHVDSIVFTSPRGVRALYWSSLIHNVYGGVRSLLHRKIIGAVGESTTSLLERLFGIDRENIVVPERFTGRDLAKALAERGVSSVLGCRASVVDPGLEKVLTSMGVKYKQLIAYTVWASKEKLVKTIGEAFEKDYIKVFVLLSSKLISERFLEAYEGISSGRKQVLVVPIGPTTADYLALQGLKPICIPEEYTLAGAIDCIATWCIIGERNILT